MGMKINDKNHMRKKSHGDIRFGNNSFNRQFLNPARTQFDKKSQLRTMNNIKPATAHEAGFNEYNSPNFMPNIQEKAKGNNTVYKVRMSALQNRAIKSNSISQQRDTTIIDKKSIIIESETEDVAKESMITQSQAIKMQNIINLVSDSEDEQSTRKKSKDSRESKKDSVISAEDDKNKSENSKTDSNGQKTMRLKSNLKEDFGKETHKRDKNSKLNEVVKRKPDSKIHENDLGDRKDIKQPQYKIKPQSPSELNKEIEEVVKDKSQEGKSVSEPVEDTSQDKVNELIARKPSERSKKELDIPPKIKTLSNNSSLHRINADEDQGEIVDKDAEISQKSPKEETKTDKVEKSAKKIETKHVVSEKGDDEVEKQVIYVKQTIESFRDSQHSVKVDEKEFNYSLKVDESKDKFEDRKINDKEEILDPEKFSIKDKISEKDKTTDKDKVTEKALVSERNKASEKGSNQQSFRPAELSLNQSPSKPSDIKEVDLDTISKKSEAISIQRSDDLNSKKSVAISVMKEDDLESRKSVAISAMKDEDLRSKKSVAISIQNSRKVATSKSSLRMPNSRGDDRSKKSVALSADPNRVPMHGNSKKSEALSADPDRVPVPEESKKSIALSADPDRVPMHGESKKSIA